MDTLIFVYNADSGFFNTLADYVHKTISPETYRCNLCSITHGLKMHEEWRAYIAALPVSVVFLHRDELAAQFGIADVALPAVFVKSENALRLAISATDINRAKSISDLKEMVDGLLRSEVGKARY